MNNGLNVNVEPPAAHQGSSPIRGRGSTISRDNRLMGVGHFKEQKATLPGCQNLDDKQVDLLIKNSDGDTRSLRITYASQQFAALAARALQECRLQYLRRNSYALLSSWRRNKYAGYIVPMSQTVISHDR